jgi:hypothetical protein
MWEDRAYEWHLLAFLAFDRVDLFVLLFCLTVEVDSISKSDFLNALEALLKVLLNPFWLL